MTFDWTIDISTILAVGGVAAGGVYAWFGTQHRIITLEKDVADLGKQVEHYRSEAGTLLGAINMQLKINHEEVIKTLTGQRLELADFKVYVAQNYAGNTALEKVELRVVDEIKELRRHLDGLAGSKRS